MRKAMYIIWFPLAIVAGLLAAVVMWLGDWISDEKNAAGVITAAAFATSGIITAAAMLNGCAAPRPAAPVQTGYPGKYSVTHTIVPASLALASGAAWGLHETSVHHADRIPAGWNRSFWDGRISWRNKYAGGNPDQGPKFPGSTTFLAWTTDAKHLFGTIHRGALFGAGVTIGIGQRRPAWHYLADAGISFAAFTLGFHSIYTLFFNKTR